MITILSQNVDVSNSQGTLQNVEIPKTPEVIQNILDVIDYLGLFSPMGMIGVILVLLALWSFFHKNSFDRFVLIFISIFKMYKKVRRYKVKRTFELGIRESVIELNREMGKHVFSHEPEIKWVSESNREEFINENKVVIRLNYHDDQNRTFMMASLGFVRMGLLPNSKQYIPETIYETTSLLVTRKILETYGRDSLNSFYSEILNPLFKSDEEIKRKFEYLSTLDQNSLFYQIFIPELHEMGIKLYPRTINSEITDREISNLINFLYTIATREHEERVPLDFISPFFKVKIIILARLEVLYNLGLSPYIKRVDEALNQGIENIYILAHSAKRRDAIKLSKRYAGNPRVSSTEVKEGKIYTPNSAEPKDCVCIVIKADEKKIQNQSEAVS